MAVEVVPATPEDVALFHPKPIPVSIQARVFKYDGKKVALCGVLMGSYPTMILIMRDSGDVPARVILSEAKKTLQEIGPQYRNLYALCDPHQPLASKFLSKLGFRYIHNEGRLEVHKWKQPC